MRFIAVLDDCNDSKEADNDRVQEEGRGREEERKGEGKRGREGGREGGSEGGSEGGRVRIAGKREKEKRERKASEGEERKESERRRKSALGERGARSTCTLYERNPRRRRWAVVHFMHAYARLYRIPCTPTTDYPEYHARLRLILLYPVYDSDRFARFFMKIANKFAYSKNSSYLCSRICARALLRARIFSNVLL